MKAVTKITFYDEQDEKFFGEGPCRLLHAIEAEGSLRAAASSMGLAYSKALRMIKNAEHALGFPLTSRTAAGKSVVDVPHHFDRRTGLPVANPAVEAL